jgi:hypothetical protein
VRQRPTHGSQQGLRPPSPTPPSQSALAWCAEPVTRRWFCIRLGGPSSTERSSSQLWSFTLVGNWSRGTRHHVIDECRCCWPPACQHNRDSTCLRSNSSPYCPLQHLAAWRRWTPRTCESSHCTKEWCHQHRWFWPIHQRRRGTF